MYCDVCLGNTRKSLLDDINRWIADPDAQRIFWLHGCAGTGKSTVCNTVSAHYKQLECLGASFHFKRGNSGRDVPSFVFGNIAYQLALFSCQFREQLLRAIDSHGKMSLHTLSAQLEMYIVEPFTRVQHTAPIVIVIDALDESSVESGRRELLNAIATKIPKLPRFVKVLLTSRDERDIHAILKAVSLPQSINEVAGTTGDILAYLRHRMHEVIDFHPQLEADNWPGPKDMEKLCSRADGLFIWAAVASTYIRDSLDPKVALNEILSGPGSKHGTQGAEAVMDKLYLDILQRTSVLSRWADATKYVVGSILVMKTPLKGTAFDLLLGLHAGLVQKPLALQDGSLIELTTSASLVTALGSLLRNDGVVRILHASVFDFFIDPNRCTDERFFIDRSKYNRELAFRCFETMDALKRDICAIHDPTKLNSEISDLDARIEHNIPQQLRYSCRFWHHHVIDDTGEHVALHAQAMAFLFSHLLHWIEVMSLLGEFDSVFTVLKDIQAWLHVSLVLMLI